MATKDKRLELIAAYREAGLHEKADELMAELFREQGIKPPDDIRAQMAKLRGDMDATMQKLRDKLGIIAPRPRKRKR
jgi:pentatricopeptide repeat protein